MEIIGTKRPDLRLLEVNLCPLNRPLSILSIEGRIEHLCDSLLTLVVAHIAVAAVARVALVALGIGRLQKLRSAVIDALRAVFSLL
jgi:hypothetical protein